MKSNNSLTVLIFVLVINDLNSSRALNKWGNSALYVIPSKSEIATFCFALSFFNTSVITSLATLSYALFKIYVSSNAANICLYSSMCNSNSLYDSLNANPIKSDLIAGTIKSAIARISNATSSRVSVDVTSYSPKMPSEPAFTIAAIVLTSEALLITSASISPVSTS